MGVATDHRGHREIAPVRADVEGDFLGAALGRVAVEHSPPAAFYQTKLRELFDSVRAGGQLNEKMRI